MNHQARVLDCSKFDDLIRGLNDTHEVFGPVARDGAVRYGRITSTSDLPRGWTDEQEPGRYRLVHDPERAELFEYAVGPDSLKQFFHPAAEVIFRAERRNGHTTFTAIGNEPNPQAFLGVRPCELAAVSVQDAVLRDGPFPDPSYVARRSGPLVIAVDCAAPAATCFCTSMGGGPGATGGFDLAITETVTEAGPQYICRSGTQRGVELLESIQAPTATPEQVDAAQTRVAEAAAAMPVRLDPDQAREVLAANPEADVWTSIEDRCLACANCTMVCPTCFCTTVTDSTDLSGETWTRNKTWDSCFSLDFSSLHQHPVRETIGARYRQWLTHKLSTWHDQFGSSGCVGCGRCITWCPVGIDLVAELDRLVDEVNS